MNSDINKKESTKRGGSDRRLAEGTSPRGKMRHYEPAIKKSLWGVFPMIEADSLMGQAMTKKSFDFALQLRSGPMAQDETGQAFTKSDERNDSTHSRPAHPREI